MTAEIPELKVGQWVRAGRDGDPGYVEKADSDQGPYEIRLLSQWDWSGPLAVRSGIGFEVIDLHGNEEEARKRADKLWSLLRAR